MRTRTASTFGSESLTQKTVTTTPSGSTTSTTVDSGFPIPGKAWTMTDVVTARFKSKRSKGHIINNNMSSSTFEVFAPRTTYLGSYSRTRYTPAGSTQGNMTLTQTYAPNPNGLEHFLPYAKCPWLAGTRDSYVGTVLPSLPSTTESALAVKVFAKAAETDVMGLVSLAELGKTLDSAVEASKALYRISRYVRKLRPRDFTPQGLLRQTANGAKIWLEYRYGVMPTVYEIGAFINRHRKLGQKARVRFTTHQDGSTRYSKTVSNTATYYVEDKEVAHTVSDRVSAGCIIEPYAQNLDELHSFGLDKLFTSAWELVPFSFVADWFVNVGEILAAHEGRYGQRVLAAWTKRSTTYAGSFQLRTTNREHRLSPYDYKGGYVRDFVCSELGTVVTRTALTSVPVMPTFKVPLDYKKWLDLSALALGFSKGLKNARL